MKTIWKFELVPFSIGTEILVSMPKRSKILMVDICERTGDFCVWALVSPGDATEFRRIILHSQGEGIANAHLLKFINSIRDGKFRWHAFEVVAPPLPGKSNESQNREEKVSTGSCCGGH